MKSTQFMRLGLRRSIAVFTAVTILVTNQFSISTAHAASVATDISPLKVFKSTDFKLPEKFGEIVESHAGNGNVIVIQDAHAIPDAQKNIANVIKYLRSEYGVGTVNLEGASGDLDPQIFKSFPDQKLLKDVMKGYLDAGEIAGGTAAAVFDKKPQDYKGVEDWGLYEEALGFYLKAMESEPELLEKLNAARKTLNAEKEKVYSKEMLAVDSAVEKFYENASQLTDLVKVLGDVKAPAVGSELEAVWKEISKQTKDNRQETKDVEVREIAKKVESVLAGKDKEIQKVFNSKKQEWMTGSVTAEAFAMCLKETAEKYDIQIEMSTDLLGMVREQRKLKELEGTKFFRDLEQYIRETKQVLSMRATSHEPRATTGDSSGGAVTSPEVAQVLALDQRTEELRVLTKLVKLELSRAEWNQLKKENFFQRATSEEPRSTGSERGAWSVVRGSDLLYHMAFYASAEERDEVFFKNLRGAWSVDRGPTVIVAGGFHAEGITNRLKEAGMGYALVMPKIGRIPENMTYRAQMRGEVSWKDYFEVENGRIHLYKAFVRATRDRLLKTGANTDMSMLKAWRDQIIRDLSDQGKVERAAWYTRYMDEVIDETLKHTDADKLMSKVDSFISGLRGLERNNQIDKEHIAQLLKANMLPTAASAGSFETNAAILEHPQNGVDLADAQQFVRSLKTGDTFVLSGKSFQMGEPTANTKIVPVTTSPIIATATPSEIAKYGKPARSEARDLVLRDEFDLPAQIGKPEEVTINNQGANHSTVFRHGTMVQADFIRVVINIGTLEFHVHIKPDDFGAKNSSENRHIMESLIVLYREAFHRFYDLGGEIPKNSVFNVYYGKTEMLGGLPNAKTSVETNRDGSKRLKSELYMGSSSYELPKSETSAKVVMHELGHLLSSLMQNQNQSIVKVGINESRGIALEEAIADYVAGNWTVTTAAGPGRRSNSYVFQVNPEALGGMSGLLQLDVERSLGGDLSPLEKAKHYLGATHHMFGEDFFDAFHAVFGFSDFWIFLQKLGEKFDATRAEFKTKSKDGTVDDYGSALVLDVFRELNYSGDRIDMFKRILYFNLKQNLFRVRGHGALVKSSSSSTGPGQTFSMNMGAVLQPLIDGGWSPSGFRAGLADIYSPLNHYLASSGISLGEDELLINIFDRLYSSRSEVRTAESRNRSELRTFSDDERLAIIKKSDEILDRQIAKLGIEYVPGSKIVMHVTPELGTSVTYSMHNSALRNVGAPLVMVPVEVKVEDLGEVKLKEVLDWIRVNPRVIGANISYPYKATAIQYLDEVDIAAQRFGVTPVYRDASGRLVGSDDAGSSWIDWFKQDFGSDFMVGKKVTVLGAGPTGLSIADEILKAGAEHVTLVDRNGDVLTGVEASEWGQSFKGRVGFINSTNAQETQNAIQQSSVLLNATGVGKHPEGVSPVPADFLRKDLIVIDTNYRPSNIKILEDAKAVGAKVRNGWGMFLYMNADQWKYYEKAVPDLHVSEEMLDSFKAAADNLEFEKVLQRASNGEALLTMTTVDTYLSMLEKIWKEPLSDLDVWLKAIHEQTGLPAKVRQATQKIFQRRKEVRDLAESIIVFNALLVEKPWGTMDGLAIIKGLAAGAGRFGESWEVSGHPERSSVFNLSTGAAISLPEIMRLAGAQNIVGTNVEAIHHSTFPLLMKFLDSHQTLSVQVHPDDKAAQKLENYPLGKNEAWYVLEAAPGAAIYVGLKSELEDGTPITRESFEHALRNGWDILPFMNRLEVKQGETFMIPAGTLHAIGGGVRIAEIQQTSDITYRVYDFNSKRPLHIDQAMQVIDFDGHRDLKGVDHVSRETAKIEKGDHVDSATLIANQAFELYEHSFSAAGATVARDTDKGFNILTVINGTVEVIADSKEAKPVTLTSGHSALLPAKLGKYKIRATGDRAIVLQSQMPATPNRSELRSVGEIQISSDRQQLAVNQLASFRTYHQLRNRYYYADSDGPGFNFSTHMTQWSTWTHWKVSEKGGIYPKIESLPKPVSTYGSLLANHAFDLWKDMRKNGQLSDSESFYVGEMGGGIGFPAADFISYVASNSLDEDRADKNEWADFLKQLRYEMFDFSDKNLAFQRQHIEKTLKFYDITRPHADQIMRVLTQKRIDFSQSSQSDQPKRKGFAFSNELLDDLPAQKLRVRSDGVIEAALMLPYLNLDELKTFVSAESIARFQTESARLLQELGLDSLQRDSIYFADESYQEVMRSMRTGGRPDVFHYLEGYVDPRLIFSAPLQTYMAKNASELSDKAIAQNKNLYIYSQSESLTQHFDWATQNYDLLLYIDYMSDQSQLLGHMNDSHARSYNDKGQPKPDYYANRGRELTLNVNSDEVEQVANDHGLDAVYHDREQRFLRSSSADSYGFGRLSGIHASIAEDFTGEYTTLFDVMLFRKQGVAGPARGFVSLSRSEVRNPFKAAWTKIQTLFREKINKSAWHKQLLSEYVFYAVMYAANPSILLLIAAYDFFELWREKTVFEERNWPLIISKWLLFFGIMYVTAPVSVTSPLLAAIVGTVLFIGVDVFKDKAPFDPIKAFHRQSPGFSRAVKENRGMVVFGSITAAVMAIIVYIMLQIGQPSVKGPDNDSVSKAGSGRVVQAEIDNPSALRSEARMPATVRPAFASRGLNRRAFIVKGGLIWLGLFLLSSLSVFAETVELGGKSWVSQSLNRPFKVSQAELLQALREAGMTSDVFDGKKGIKNLQNSISFSDKQNEVVDQAFRRIKDAQKQKQNRIKGLERELYPENTPWGVVFAKGLKNASGWAMAINDLNVIVVSADDYEEVKASDRVNWIIEKITHEGIHLWDHEKNPNISGLETERNAFWGTYWATVLTGKEEPVQKQVAQAFDVLIEKTTFKRKYKLEEIFGDGSFPFLYYSNIATHLDNDPNLIGIEVFDTRDPEINKMIVVNTANQKVVQILSKKAAARSEARTNGAEPTLMSAADVIQLRDRLHDLLMKQKELQAELRKTNEVLSDLRGEQIGLGEEIHSNLSKNSAQQGLGKTARDATLLAQEINANKNKRKDIADNLDLNQQELDAVTGKVKIFFGSRNAAKRPQAEVAPRATNSQAEAKPDQAQPAAEEQKAKQDASPEAVTIDPNHLVGSDLGRSAQMIFQEGDAQRLTQAEMLMHQLDQAIHSDGIQAGLEPGSETDVVVSAVEKENPGQKEQPAAAETIERLIAEIRQGLKKQITNEEKERRMAVALMRLMNNPQMQWQHFEFEPSIDFAGLLPSLSSTTGAIQVRLFERDGKLVFQIQSADSKNIRDEFEFSGEANIADLKNEIHFVWLTGFSGKDLASGDSSKSQMLGFGDDLESMWGKTSFKWFFGISGFLALLMIAATYFIQSMAPVRLDGYADRKQSAVNSGKSSKVGQQDEGPAANTQKQKQDLNQSGQSEQDLKKPAPKNPIITDPFEQELIQIVEGIKVVEDANVAWVSAFDNFVKVLDNPPQDKELSNIDGEFFNAYESALRQHKNIDSLAARLNDLKKRVDSASAANKADVTAKKRMMDQLAEAEMRLAKARKLPYSNDIDMAVRLRELPGFMVKTIEKADSDLTSQTAKIQSQIDSWEAARDKVLKEYGVSKQKTEAAVQEVKNQYLSGKISAVEAETKLSALKKEADALAARNQGLVRSVSAAIDGAIQRLNSAIQAHQKRLTSLKEKANILNELGASMSTVFKKINESEASLKEIQVPSKPNMSLGEATNSVFGLDQPALDALISGLTKEGTVLFDSFDKLDKHFNVLQGALKKEMSGAPVDAGEVAKEIDSLKSDLDSLRETRRTDGVSEKWKNEVEKKRLALERLLTRIEKKHDAKLISDIQVWQKSYRELVSKINEWLVAAQDSINLGELTTATKDKLSDLIANAKTDAGKKYPGLIESMGKSEQLPAQFTEDVKTMIKQTTPLENVAGVITWASDAFRSAMAKNDWRHLYFGVKGEIFDQYDSGGMVKTRVTMQAGNYESEPWVHLNVPHGLVAGDETLSVTVPLSGHVAYVSHPESGLEWVSTEAGVRLSQSQKNKGEESSVKAGMVELSINGPSDQIRLNGDLNRGDLSAEFDAIPAPIRTILDAAKNGSTAEKIAAITKVFESYVGYSTDRFNVEGSLMQSIGEAMAQDKARAFFKCDVGATAAFLMGNYVGLDMVVLTVATPSETDGNVHADFILDDGVLHSIAMYKKSDRNWEPFDWTTIPGLPSQGFNREKFLQDRVDAQKKQVSQATGSQFAGELMANAFQRALRADISQGSNRMFFDKPIFLNDANEFDVKQYVSALDQFSSLDPNKTDLKAFDAALGVVTPFLMRLDETARKQYASKLYGKLRDRLAIGDYSTEQMAIAFNFIMEPLGNELKLDIPLWASLHEYLLVPNAIGEGREAESALAEEAKLNYLLVKKFLTGLQGHGSLSGDDMAALEGMMHQYQGFQRALEKLAGDLLIDNLSQYGEQNKEILRLYDSLKSQRSEMREIELSDYQPPHKDLVPTAGSNENADLYEKFTAKLSPTEKRKFEIAFLKDLTAAMKAHIHFYNPRNFRRDVKTTEIFSVPENRDPNAESEGVSAIEKSRFFDKPEDSEFYPYAQLRDKYIQDSSAANPTLRAPDHENSLPLVKDMIAKIGARYIGANYSLKEIFGKDVYGDKIFSSDLKARFLKLDRILVNFFVNNYVTRIVGRVIAGLIISAVAFLVYRIFNLNGSPDTLREYFQFYILGVRLNLMDLSFVVLVGKFMTYLRIHLIADYFTEADQDFYGIAWLREVRGLDAETIEDNERQYERDFNQITGKAINELEREGASGLEVFQAKRKLAKMKQILRDGAQVNQFYAPYVHAIKTLMFDGGVRVSINDLVLLMVNGIRMVNPQYIQEKENVWSRYKKIADRLFWMASLGNEDERKPMFNFDFYDAAVKATHDKLWHGKFRTRVSEKLARAKIAFEASDESGGGARIMGDTELDVKRLSDTIRNDSYRKQLFFHAQFLGEFLESLKNTNDHDVFNRRSLVLAEMVRFLFDVELHLPNGDIERAEYNNFQAVFKSYYGRILRALGQNLPGEFSDVDLSGKDAILAREIAQDAPVSKEDLTKLAELVVKRLIKVRDTKVAPEVGKSQRSEMRNPLMEERLAKIFLIDAAAEKLKATFRGLNAEHPGDILIQMLGYESMNKFLDDESVSKDAVREFIENAIKFNDEDPNTLNLEDRLRAFNHVIQLVQHGLIDPLADNGDKANEIRTSLSHILNNQLDLNERQLIPPDVDVKIASVRYVRSRSAKDVFRIVLNIEPKGQNLVESTVAINVATAVKRQKTGTVMEAKDIAYKKMVNQATNYDGSVVPVFITDFTDEFGRLTGYLEEFVEGDTQENILEVIDSERSQKAISGIPRTRWENELKLRQSRLSAETARTTFKIYKILNGKAPTDLNHGNFMNRNHEVARVGQMVNVDFEFVEDLTPLEVLVAIAEYNYKRQDVDMNPMFDSALSEFGDAAGLTFLKSAAKEINDRIDWLKSSGPAHLSDFQVMTSDERLRFHSNPENLFKGYGLRSLVMMKTQLDQYLAGRSEVRVNVAADLKKNNGSFRTSRGMVVSLGNETNKEFAAEQKKQPQVLLVDLDAAAYVSKIESHLFHALFFAQFFSAEGKEYATLNSNLQAAAKKIAATSHYHDRAIAEAEYDALKTKKAAFLKKAKDFGYEEFLLGGDRGILSRKLLIAVPNDNQRRRVLNALALTFFSQNKASLKTAMRSYQSESAAAQYSEADLDVVLSEFESARSFMFPGASFAGMSDRQIMDKLSEFIQVRDVSQTAATMSNGTATVSVSHNENGFEIKEGETTYTAETAVFAQANETSQDWSQAQTEKLKKELALKDNTLRVINFGTADPTDFSKDQDYTNMAFYRNGRLILTDPSIRTIRNLEKQGFAGNVAVIHLTHVHYDHVGGLLDIIRRQLAGESLPKFKLIASYAAYAQFLNLAAALNGKTEAEIAALFDYQIPQRVENKIETVTFNEADSGLGEVTLEMARTYGHPIPTYGVKVISGGVRISYLSDSMMPSEALKDGTSNPRYNEFVDYFNDADILISENGVPGVHIEPKQLVKAFPEHVRRGTLFTVHSAGTQQQAELTRFVPFMTLTPKKSTLRDGELESVKQQLTENDAIKNLLHLNDQMINDLAVKGEIVRFEAGNTLYEEGADVEHHDAVYILLSGQANVTIGQGGRQGSPIVLEAGAVAGELALLTRMVPVWLYVEMMLKAKGDEKLTKFINQNVVSKTIDDSSYRAIEPAVDLKKLAAKAGLDDEQMQKIKPLFEIAQSQVAIPRTATVTAGTNGVSVFAIPKDEFLKFLADANIEAHPERVDFMSAVRELATHRAEEAHKTEALLRTIGAGNVRAKRSEARKVEDIADDVVAHFEKNIELTKNGRVLTEAEDAQLAVAAKKLAGDIALLSAFERDAFIKALQAKMLEVAAKGRTVIRFSNYQIDQFRRDSAERFDVANTSRESWIQPILLTGAEEAYEIRDLVAALLAQGDSLSEVYVRVQDESKVRHIRQFFKLLNGNGRVVKVESDKFENMILKDSIAGKVATVISLRQITEALGNNLQGLGTQGNGEVDTMVRMAYIESLIRAGRMISSQVKSKNEVNDGFVARISNVLFGNTGVLSYHDGVIEMIPSAIESLISDIRSTQAAAKAA